MRNNNVITFVYASCLMSKPTLEKAFNEFPENIGLEVQKYHRLIVEGLVANNVDVKAISFQPGLEDLNNSPEIESFGGVEYNYLKSKKKHFSHIDIARKSYKLTKEILKNNKQSYVICDVLNYSVSLGAVLAAKKMKAKSIGIITDFPEGSHAKGSIKIPLTWNLIKKFDSYVVLTKQMLQKLNGKKKSVVLEGQADINFPQNINPEDKKYEDFVCLYAGSVHERYGIKALIDGFLKANIPNSRMIVFGGGDYAECLKKINDKRIDYRGIQPNEVVLKEEQKATLLINPRPTDADYVLYSFPSKTIEYMTTGTPVLTTKLAGIPEEYYDYIYFFDGFDSDNISNKIKEMSSYDKEELFNKGRAAKNFVLKQKNNVIQAGKIVEMVTKI